LGELIVSDGIHPKVAKALKDSIHVIITEEMLFVQGHFQSARPSNSLWAREEVEAGSRRAQRSHGTSDADTDEEP
jgi:hypothetical protein